MRLAAQLEEVASRFKELPATEFAPGWQKNVAKARAIKPRNLCAYFSDPAGRALRERLILLARLGSKSQLPVLFQ
jgi:hypothetical protein